MSDVIQQLQSQRIVPVVVIERLEDAVPLAHALVSGGLRCIEVTLRTEVALRAMREIAAQVPEVVLGAGSLRRAEQVAPVLEAGAEFLVSPGLTIELSRAVAGQAPLIPGTATASEVMRAVDLGHDLVKFFPAAQLGGVDMLQALSAPLPEVQFFPTGGIRPENVDTYLSLPCVACVGGTWLTPQASLAQQDFAAIQDLAKQAGAVPN